MPREKEQRNAEIVGALKAGATLQEVADLFGLSHPRVWRIANRVGVRSIYRRGRPPKNGPRMVKVPR